MKELLEKQATLADKINDHLIRWLTSRYECAVVSLGCTIDFPRQTHDLIEIDWSWEKDMEEYASMGWSRMSDITFTFEEAIFSRLESLGVHPSDLIYLRDFPTTWSDPSATSRGKLAWFGWMTVFVEVK